MRSYRLVLLLKSDLKKERKQGILKDVEKWAGRQILSGGKARKSGNGEIKELGERKLAYPIKRELKGEYILLEFEAEKVEAGLEKRIQMEEDILRHLLVRVK